MNKKLGSTAVGERRVAGVASRFGRRPIRRLVRSMRIESSSLSLSLSLSSSSSSSSSPSSSSSSSSSSPLISFRFLLGVAAFLAKNEIESLHLLVLLTLVDRIRVLFGLIFAKKSKRKRKRKKKIDPRRAPGGPAVPGTFRPSYWLSRPAVSESRIDRRAARWRQKKTIFIWK